MAFEKWIYSTVYSTVDIICDITLYLISHLNFVFMFVKILSFLSVV